MGFNYNAKIWFNGKLVTYREAEIGIGSHGLHYGTGVFEGIRCYETSRGSAIFRLKPHLERLFASAAVYDFPIGFSLEELMEGVKQVVQANDLKTCYIRPICFLGDETLGVHGKPKLQVAIMAWSWLNPQGTSADGVRVTVSPWQKFHHRMMPTTAKACGQYVNSVLAVREAASRGFDAAVLLNAEGNLAEGAVENLFLVKNGTLITNDQHSSILLGITRASILDLAKDFNIPTEIRIMTLADFQSADEAFFTGTAVEISPIRELDGKIIGLGKPGPITLRLRKAFREVTSGQYPSRLDWITLITGTPVGASTH